MENKFRLGILGGMGPEATAILYQKIVEKSKKYITCDQDHIHTIITSNTQIPDRTEAILNRGENPVDSMMDSLRVLKAADVSVVVMPCNTAHYFLSELSEKSQIRFIDMIEETAKYLVRNNAKTVGILATDGTIKSKIYEKYLMKFGIKLIIPNAEVQKKTMNLIYGSKGIKSGFTDEGNRQKLQECLASFNGKNVDKVILGCSELGLVTIDDRESKKKVIDPIEVVSDLITNDFYCKEK